MLRNGIIFIFALFISVSSAFAAESFEEGIEYISIQNPVATSHPDKVVVTEIFWYGCPHCFRLEPYIERWKQNLTSDIVFEQMPSVLNASWMEHARAFFALEMMGDLEKVHQKICNALHLQNRRLNSVDTLAEFVKEQGLDEAKFREHYHSFPVDSKVRKNKQIERVYGHTGVPAIVVNGKYRTSAPMAGSNARMMEVVDFLVKKELAAKN